MKAIRTVYTVVRQIRPAGPGIAVFELEDPDRWELPPFTGGAHLDCHLPNGMVRSYSLCGDPADRYRYEIAVKREDLGRGGSMHLHDDVALGSVIRVSLPRATFPLAPSAERHVFIAGGIGVTPFLSMAASLEAGGNTDYALHLFHRGETPMANEIARYRESGRVFVHRSDLDAPNATPRPELAALIGEPVPGTHLYCCGPQKMIDGFLEATQHWPPAQVHVEHFVPPALEADERVGSYTLVLAKSKKQTEVPAGGSALDAIRGLGIEVDASCEGGICGACRVHWLEGPPVHRDLILSDAEREHDVMVCVCSAAGEKLVLDL